MANTHVLSSMATLGLVGTALPQFVVVNQMTTLREEAEGNIFFNGGYPCTPL